MFDTVVIATDGSQSAQRAVSVAFSLAMRFEASIHACYVVDEGEVASTPEAVREEMEAALEEAGDQALSFVEERAELENGEVVTEVREGAPAEELVSYAEIVDADVLATGTRGRHGEHGFLLGSVAEAIVRSAPMPVLTVRQLEGDGERPERPV